MIFVYVKNIYKICIVCGCKGINCIEKILIFRDFSKKIVFIMSGFHTRLKEYIDSRKLSVARFEMLCGISNGTLARALKQEKSVTTDSLEKILGTFSDLSAEWLLRGICPEPGHSSMTVNLNSSSGGDINNDNRHTVTNITTALSGKSFKDFVSIIKQKDEIIIQKDRLLLEKDGLLREKDNIIASLTGGRKV